MPKRLREQVATEGHQKKRKYPENVDRLSCLSDELLLTILTNLSVPTLTLCQRLSHRFYTLAGDSQLWKAAFYSRFVLPRASRIPGIKDPASTSNHLLFSSRVSMWLDDESLVRRGSQTDWKRQYKLRHKWSRGSCDVSEIQVADEPPLPPLLVQLHAGIVFTADSTAGLRAWSIGNEQSLLAQIDLRPRGEFKLRNERPTSMAVNVLEIEDEVPSVAIGFENGRFSIFKLLVPAAVFYLHYTHPPSSSGSISAIAYSAPYLVTMTKAQLLSLYRFDPCQKTDSPLEVSNTPRLLSSLKSHTVWPPLSLSIRLSNQSIVTSIAYALPTYLSGWSVGLQELRLTPEGGVLESRLAFAVNQGFQPLNAISAPPVSPSADLSIAPSRGLESLPDHSVTKPTSLSYTHPYLLASHPDNTLTLYMVTTTSSALRISTGSRLWGHTASVSGAHVGNRGKAVSVSIRGDELRVWELEGGISSSSSRRRVAAGEASVRVHPEPRTDFEQPEMPATLGKFPVGDEKSKSGCRDVEEGWSRTEGWVGFDDEKVIILKEKGRRTQALVIYDFT